MKVIFFWSTVTCCDGGPPIWASTYTTMPAADRIPCAVTLPWMSAARPTPAVIAKKPVTRMIDRIVLCPMNFILNLFSLRVLSSETDKGSQIRSEQIVDPDYEAIGAEELTFRAKWLLPAALVLENSFDVGPNQNLDARRKSVARVVLGSTVEEITRRVHHIVAHDGDHPGKNPVFRFTKSSSEGHRRRLYQSTSLIVGNEVLITTVHSKPVKLKVPILE